MVDGNKRLGIALLLILCKLNNINISYTQQELIELGLSIAKGIYTKEDIKDWIIRHSTNKN